MSQADSVLLVRHEAGAAWLTLNRPDAGNAINYPLAEALLAAALALENDTAVRCVVITGTGKLFCAGGDVPSFAAAPEGPGAYLRKLAGKLHEALLVFARMSKPVITVVNGPAAGAGMSLAIGGDIALASRRAHFTPAYGAIGLTPDGGMSWTLPRLVGLRTAQEILLTNRRIGAEEAQGLGMITRVADEDALMDEARALVAQLVASPVAAAGTVRRLLLESYGSDLATQLDREVIGISAAGDGAEGREGVASYLEKRPADFTAV